MFEYDRNRGLAPEETGIVEDEHATVEDLLYASPFGGKVPAYLILPRQCSTPPCSLAALLFLHHGFGDRRTFLPEALALAPAGVASLHTDAPFLRPDYAAPTGPRPVEEAAEAEARMYRQMVVDLRRGVDLLLTRPEVDPDRIGYVGHSLGATWGGPLAGVEKRIKAFVLMAGYPSLTHTYRTSLHPDLVRRRGALPPDRFERYLSVLEPLDAVHYVGRAAPSAVLFQYATADEWVTREDAERYYATTSEPKEMAWYDTDHLFTTAPQARLDRARWLGHHLKFDDSLVLSPTPESPV